MQIYLPAAGAPTRTYFFVFKQGIAVLLGALLAVAAMTYDYRRLNRPYAIGAVFGEYAGSSDGLGYVLIQATPQLQTSLAFAAIVLLTAISVALFWLVSIAERLLVPWASEGTDT